MSRARHSNTEDGGPSFFAAQVAEPLASRLRPRTLDEYVGQRHLLGVGMPLREAISRGRVDSMVFWGPPGVGKTTLARLLAQSADAAFVAFSAVSDGVARVREVVQEAARRRTPAAAPSSSSMRFIDSTARNKTRSCRMSKAASWY